MEEKRIQVFGKDANGEEKHSFDLLMIDGKAYIESIYKGNRRVKTPVETALAALKELQQPQAG